MHINIHMCVYAYANESYTDLTHACIEGFEVFFLSGRFEAQLLANVTLGIPMQPYMGLCMSLRHGPGNG